MPKPAWTTILPFVLPRVARMTRLRPPHPIMGRDVVSLFAAAGFQPKSSQSPPLEYLDLESPLKPHVSKAWSPGWCYWEVVETLGTSGRSLGYCGAPLSSF
jgi:hypothetical protein